MREGLRTGRGSPPRTDGFRMKISALPALILALSVHAASAAGSDQPALQTLDDANTRFSALQQIDAGNVARLKVAWTFSTGVLRGHEGAPLVVGSVMYVHTPFPNIVYALDLDRDGRILWRYEPRQDANVIPVILDQELGLVEHGRGKRLADPKQRTAIFARDRGCTFPGCTRSAADSQVHHMLDWLQLGETNPDNLTLACGYHNNEGPRQGWKAIMINGIPHWTPPPWQGPDQKPRRNYLHHPELLLRT